MAGTIIEGIDNEVLFVFSVFVAFATIVLVHVVYKLTRNGTLSTRQNESNNSSDSTTSFRPEDQRQENSWEGQGRRSYIYKLNNFVRLCQLSANGEPFEK